MIGWLDFLTVIILAFAIFMVITGLFTAWFGNGKSRIAGFAMLVAGVIVGAIWIVLSGSGSIMDPVFDVDVWNVFLNALVDVIGVMIGALIAIGIFLLAVLKS